LHKTLIFAILLRIEIREEKTMSDFLFGFLIAGIPLWMLNVWLSSWLNDNPQYRENKLREKYGVDYRIHCEKKFGKNWRKICKVDYSE